MLQVKQEDKGTVHVLLPQSDIKYTQAIQGRTMPPAAEEDKNPTVHADLTVKHIYLVHYT